MLTDDNFMKEWINFMYQHINGTYKIPLYVPNKYSNLAYFIKTPIVIDINVNCTKKYNKSVEIEYYLLDNKFTDVIYLSFNKSIKNIKEDIITKIDKKINDWLLKNNPAFVENKYQNIIDKLKNNMLEYNIKKRKDIRIKKINKIK